MAGTIFGIPFDDEIFMNMWNEAPDPYLTAMVQSGAMVEDGTIAGMIQGQGIFIQSHFITLWMEKTRTMTVRQILPYLKLAAVHRPA